MYCGNFSKLHSFCTFLEQRTGCRQPADGDHMQGLVVVHVCLLALVCAGLCCTKCVCAVLLSSRAVRGCAPVQV